MAKIKSPCKFCSEREPGCHSECEAYKKYKFTVKIVQAKRNGWRKHVPFETNGMGGAGWEKKK